MSSFALKNGDAGKAFSSFAKSVLVFILIPLSTFALLDGLMGIAASQGGSNLDPDALAGMADMLRQITERAIKYSMPLLIIAIPMGFYPRGNAAKIPFRLIWAIYMMIWIWVLAEGGQFTTSLNEISFGSFTVRSIEITLDLTFILYITMMVCIARGFLAFSEYGSYREEYLENLEKREEKRDRRKKKRGAAEEV